MCLTWNQWSSMSSYESYQREAFASSLARLAEYTAKGQQLAWQSIEVLDSVAKKATEEIRGTIDWLESSDLEDAQIGDYLAAQLGQISREISLLPYQIAEELDTLPDETFTISLFGRTKAGKSTLVSILTEGDDSIIGKGKQRTTLKARPFFWEGLKVFDVPGVSAAGDDGEEDAKEALKAARPSDLIIFVVGSDSFQKETASYLARVKALGKPVMCLVNIKEGRVIRAGHEEGDVETLCWCIDRAFSDKSKLSGIRDAVLAYDDEFSQKWGPMPFAYAHLRSAFLAQQMEGTPWSARLMEASRFQGAIGHISDGIRRAGCFMRLKSYVNVTSGYMIEAYEGLARQGVDSLVQLRMFNARIRQYEEWVDEFKESCDRRARTLVRDICEDLKAEADMFAEDHYEDKHADETWNATIRKCRGEKKANKLLSEFQDEATEKLRTLGREISFEINFLRLKQGKDDVNPQMFIDKNLIWNRAMTAAEVVLGVAAMATQAPVVITAGLVAAGAHAVGNLVFKDGDRERADAIREFRRRLGESIASYGNRLSAQISEVVRTGIIEARLDVFTRTMRSLYEGIASLATTQLALAAQVECQINNLGLNLVGEALNYDDNGCYASSIVRVARVPGDSLLLVTKKHASIPPEVLNRLAKLLEEATTIEVSDSGKVSLSDLVENTWENGILVEFASPGEHLIAYSPTAHGSELIMTRLSMQLNSIVEIS